ncbi:NADPH dehydrogenase 1 [Yarrowia sp. B02]|nr:NADPH dehydrogenase 1 [Yarrowia sp. B02]
MDNLFKPIKVGSTELSNRIVLAPLTRIRADKHIPSDLAVEYYTQRASFPGTLLITEATYIHPSCAGHKNRPGLVPGVWSDEKVLAGWKRVVDSVHAKKSKIYVQLWDLGRVADYETLQEIGGYDLVGPSAIAQTDDEEGQKHIRELTVAEIKQKVEYFAQAAKNAIFEAGADGVEIHSANGYLPDQFLHWNSNQRTDEYGGSVENRARFVLEVVDAVVAAVGADKVGVRFSPWTTYQDMDVSSEKTQPQFEYLFEQLEKRGVENKRLAYIHVVEPRADGVNDVTPKTWQSNEPFRKIWTGNLIRAGGFKRQSAIEAAQQDDKTLIAFGRYFISNPDLVYRLKEDKKLTQYDRSTFYLPGKQGYTDYDFYEE